jgi:hypothetical protein
MTKEDPAVTVWPNGCVVMAGGMGEVARVAPAMECRAPSDAVPTRAERNTAPSGAGAVIDPATPSVGKAGDRWRKAMRSEAGRLSQASGR